MRKVQFGCGGNRLEGWENYDRDVDISKPLPFEDNSIKFIFAEHVLEHVHVHSGFRFLKEVYRILEPNGTARICVPAIDKLNQYFDEDYGHFLKFHSLGDGSKLSALESILYNFEHVACYTTEMLDIFCSNIGFKTVRCEPRISAIAELHDIDSHWKAIGEKANLAESGIIEATKS